MNIITTGVNQHNTPIIVARLHLSFCKIINFPQNGIDCSSTNQTKCIQCPVQGGYYFTSSQSEGRETSPGFWIALTFWLLTIAVAITGLINSVIIIIVLRRSAKATNAAFNYLLIFLADVDCVCAFVTLCSATAEMAILGNIHISLDLFFITKPRFFNRKLVWPKQQQNSLLGSHDNSNCHNAPIHFSIYYYSNNTRKVFNDYLSSQGHPMVYLAPC